MVKPLYRAGLAEKLAADAAHDDLVDLFLAEQAKAEGLSYHEFCQKHGIVDASLERQLRRREIRDSDLPPDMKLENRTAWGGPDRDLVGPVLAEGSNSNNIPAKRAYRVNSRQRRDYKRKIYNNGNTESRNG